MTCRRCLSVVIFIVVFSSGTNETQASSVLMFPFFVYVNYNNLPNCCDFFGSQICLNEIVLSTVMFHFVLIIPCYNYTIIIKTILNGKDCISDILK